MHHAAAHRAALPRRGSRWAALAVTVGLVLGCVLVWRSSYAAFSDPTSNPGNMWAGGTVSLADNDSGAALFNVTGLIPGNTDTQCVLVTYTGNVTSTVRLYAADYLGALGPYLNLVVEVGDGSTCGDFGNAATLFSGTLHSLRTSNTDFATGLPAVNPWSPSANGAVKPYRFTYSLADDNAAQGATADVDFVWAAQSV